LIGRRSVRLRLGLSIALLSITCIALLAGLIGEPAFASIQDLLFKRHANEVKVRRTLGDWTLTVWASQFSGDKACVLEDYKHHVSYVTGALGFRFARRINTLGAWVRIDDEAPVRWRDYLPELTRLGVPMDGASLDNPTDGIVWVPADALGEANRITIQPRERSRPVTFHLRGFAGLRDVAREMGCTPESRFVR